MSKSGYVVLLIGKMHTGKTPKVKQLVESNDLKRLVLDVREEYPITYSKVIPSDFENKEEAAKYFMRKAETAEDSNIVIEEATAFFNGYNDKQLMYFVTGIEHNHCVGYFCFHSIKKTPQTLIDLCEFIVLYKTGESLSTVIKKDARFKHFYLKQKKLKAHQPVYISKTNKKWSED